MREAIEWQLRMRAACADDLLQRELQAWLLKDDQHQLAWQRMQQMGELFQADRLPDPDRTIPLLRRAEADLGRRRALKVLGWCVTVGGTSLLAAQGSSDWRADYATGTGERKQLAIADAHVMLNTGSAADLVGNTLQLRAGEVLIDGRGWRARCRFATCTGADSSVVLRERGARSEIHVRRGEVLITTAAGTKALRAGESAAATKSGLAVIARGPIDPFAWARGLIVVDDARLADVLAEAGRYRQGWLGCDPAVANLRLSGVFRLDAPERMLENLTHLLPVRVVERTRWWVRIVPLA